MIIKKIYSSVSLLLCSSLLSAGTIQQNTDHLVNQVDPSINISAQVIDLNTGETLYQRNAARALIPASNMKLFSNAAALLVLGPDYRFKTTLLTDASRLENGHLHGSLYLVMPGDPSFTSAGLDELFKYLPKLGIQQIEGNVVLVSDHASIKAYPPGWADKDRFYSYGAPLAPTILDENRLTITVNPGARIGQPALIELSSAPGSILVDNKVKTASKSQGCGLSYLMNDHNQLTIRGCVGLGQWAAVEKIAIQNPLLYADAQIRNRLSSLHIQLKGKVQLGHQPPYTLTIGTHTSKPITQLMADTLKPSDNLYADSLYLHAAKVIKGSPANWPEAQQLVRSFLQKQTGIDLSSALFTDGSGLSRLDKLSAQQTVGLLRYLHTHFPLTYEYISALPVAGQDGTLQRRFKKMNQQGFLRAKTGTLSGVVSLSGYLYTANAHTLAFALFINRNPGTSPAIAGRYRSLIDSLCDFLLQQKPEGHSVASLANAHERVSFQQHPTQAELIRAQNNRVRRLEYAIKQAIKGMPATLLYRKDHLVIKDDSTNIQAIWQALSSIRKKYPFSIELEGMSAPPVSAHSLLWIKSTPSGHARIWTVRDV